jgi:electron transfer flavoprotein beta subunit
MVNILVTIKQCVDVDSVRPDRSTGLIALQNSQKKFNDFDKNALEEAIRIREKVGGKVTVLSVGEPTVKEVLKEALSIGADEAFYVSDPAVKEFDSRAVALVVSRFYRKAGPFDLILMGDGSVDHYSMQVGPRVAELLGLPDVTYVRKLEMKGSSVLVERDFEDGYYVTEVRLPAVITVAQEINQPRLPTLRSILSASKREIKLVPLGDLTTTAAELMPVVKIVETHAPKVERRKTMIDATNAEQAAVELVRSLQKEGVI